MVAELKYWSKKRLSWEETKNLILEYRKGSIEARDKVIKYNLWVVGAVNLRMEILKICFQARDTWIDGSFRKI